VAGTGSGTSGGRINFTSFYQYQRSGLVLLNGVVYIAISSVGDQGPYHGWVMAYDAKTLEQLSVWVDTPNARQGGIWMAGAAPAADGFGNLYFTTGNGTFTANAGGVDYGDSLVRLQTTSGILQLADYFTPADQARLAVIDGDFGSGGVMLLPDEAGSEDHPHLAVACGKDGAAYLLDRDDLGHFNAGGDTQALSVFPSANSSFGSPAYFNHTVYYAVVRDVLRSFAVAAATMSPAPLQSAQENLGYPGATPCVSANGTNDAIVWVVQTSGFSLSQPAILRAYDPNNLSQELYDSSASGTRDRPGIGMKFAVPIVTDGKVFVGTDKAINVFGLFPPPVLSVAGPGKLTLTGRSGVTYVVQVTEDLGAANSWQTLSTVPLLSTRQSVEDLEAPGKTVRYYRALAGPP
jgi:hypothetical protein